MLRTLTKGFQMRMKEGVCWLAAVVLVLPLLGASPAAAIEWQGFTITPSISYTGEYDDNIFRTGERKQHDYVNTITPAIQLEYKGTHEIQAGYKADILRYSRFNNLDTVRHTALLNGTFNFARTQLRFGEEYKRTDDFPSTELTQRLPRDENALGFGADYDMARTWGVGFDFKWGLIHYLRDPATGIEDPFGFSRNSYTFAPSFYYRLTSKTRVFFEPDFVVERFTNATVRDNNRYRALVGARGDFTERFSLTGKAGFEYLDFTEDNATQGDQAGFVAEVEASYRPVERLQFALILRRETIPSTQSSNLFYDSFNTIFAATYNFTPKLSIIPRLAIGVDNYRESALNPDTGNVGKRLDYLYGAGVGLRYQIQKWLRVEGNYDFSARDSNFNLSDYVDNRLWFSVMLSM